MTLAAHPYQVGDTIFVTGSSLAHVNGLKIVATVPTVDTFTFAAQGADGNAAGAIKAGRPASGVLATPAHERSKSDAYTGYGMIIGGAFYENLMPDATGAPKALPQAIKMN